MADSASVRGERHRRHRAGDRSLCRPGRCDLAPRSDNGSGRPPVIPGGVAEATRALLAPLVRAWPPDDPRQTTAACARRLAEAIDAPSTAPSALPGLVNQLAVTMSHCTDAASSLPGKLDEVRARRAARLLNSELAAAAFERRHAAPPNEKGESYGD